MKRISALFAFLLFALSSFAQQPVSGTARDGATGEGLIGAIVMVNGKASASCDLNGHYRVMLSDGEYYLTVKFFGYTCDSVKITIAGKPVNLDFNCVSATMKEVRIVADVAIDRKTPVAFSNINETKIREEGGGRDMTLMLNSTPGAYATEQGGGSGDSRVSIRGADQRNVGVMVDGVPMNDMENGQVYWSNWDGLTDATRTIQVQRGLGASRLAIPSVGGTINVLTRGIDEKKSFSVSSSFSTGGSQKLSMGYNSGEFGKGWGFTMTGSRKTGNGWANQTWDDSWAYYFKIQKRIDKHLISLSVNGAPQSHGQRYDRLPIAVYDYSYARSLFAKEYGDHGESYLDSLNNANLLTGGYTTLTQGERGRRFNPNWGTIVYPDGQKGALNQDINFYHKPLFNLSWFWSPNEKFSLSTVAYVSIGYGGGTNFNSTPNRDTLTGQFLLTAAYNSNSTLIDPLYSTTEHKATRVLLASMNNHVWEGALTTATWHMTDKVTLLFGADARHYKGSHYRMLYDLIGGDYFINSSDANQPSGAGNTQYAMKHKGDKVSYWNDSYVDWGGLFAQAEYSGNRFSTFLTLTGSLTQYQRVDHFKKRDIVLEDGTVVPMIVGYNEVLYTNGTDQAVAQNNAVITALGGDTLVIDNPSGPNDTIVGAKAYAWSSEYARTAQTVKKTFPGFTIKTGANYNLDEHYNVFMNLGFMNMAPRFNTVFDNNNKEYPAAKQQIVYASEIGIGARFPEFAANLNAYYTNWANKPPVSAPTISIAGDPYTYDLTGLNTTLMGTEIDFNWKPVKKFSAEGLISVGNWTYHSSGMAYLYDANYELADSIAYSAKGVHLGDAAQTQLGGSVRWEPFEGFYIKPRFTYFARNYANFDPIVLTPVYNGSHVQVGDNRDKESWIMPSYGLLDIYAGYQVIEDVAGKQIKVSFTAGVTNLLDTIYVSDAVNGAHFDAASSLVYMGLGRRWIAGMRITF
jgi:hypothetical protein